MTRKKKSWQEKLGDSKDLPKIIKPKGKGATHYGDRMQLKKQKTKEENELHLGGEQ